MGRPINKKYFVPTGSNPGDVEGYTGVVGSVSAGGLYYSQGTTITISSGSNVDSFAARATLTISTSTGAVTAITMLTYGNGYTNAASTAYTINNATATNITAAVSTLSSTLTNVSSVSGIYVGMLATDVGVIATGSYVVAVSTNSVTLSSAGLVTTTTSNVSFTDTGTGAVITFAAYLPLKPGTIAATAWVGTDTQARAAAIIKQTNSRGYLCETNAGEFIGNCQLTTSTITQSGYLTMTATDINGSTYYISKLTAGRAVLWQNTMNGSFEYGSDTAVGWSVNAATTGTVQITTNSV